MSSDVTVTPVLEIRNLRKTFGDVVAVADVTERLEGGEYFCILGPSGCGKTTLLRLIAGFEVPDAGGLTLDGKPLEGTTPERRDLNVVFQNYALFPHMTLAENVAFGLRMKGVPKAEVRRRTGEALDLVRLSGERDRLPRQLSGGQQQRVALARALVNRPRLLLLDEPLSALDRGLRLAMQEELRTLQRETGITFLHITHDQSEALALADRLAVMASGRFVQVGTPQQVYERPTSRFVAEFLGASNILEAGRVVGDRVHMTMGPALILARPPVAGTSNFPVSIRPEHVRLSRDGSAGPGENVLAARVRRVAFAGPIVECRVETPVGPLSAQLAGRLAGGPPVEGEDLYVRISAEDVIALAAVAHAGAPVRT